VQQVLALAGLEPSLRVLDLPCGVGRHSLELARLGCDVTAVDRTPAYLDQARTQAEAAGLPIEFVQADMRVFRRNAEFDLALNLFTSFGYFDDPQDDFRVLDNFFAALKPGGKIVMDMMGKEVLARVFTPRDWHVLDDGRIVLEDRKITADWTRVENRWIILQDGQQREFPFFHRVYGASDLRLLLTQAGFDVITIYGNLSGAPYDHEAQRLVAVAQKPA
jgi:SAM-dependent methyltransferase